MPNYLNGLEILGTPKTVRLEGTWHGETFAAPLECWIAAMVDVLTPEQKTTLFTSLQRMLELRDIQRRSAVARVVADIPLPNLRT